MKSKRKSWNTIIFVFYMVLLLVGIASTSVLRPIGGSFGRLVTGQYNLYEAKDTIESALTDELTYHNLLLEINGLRENLLGTRVIQKKDITIVKSESGSLLTTEIKIEDTDILSSAELFRKLQKVSESNGAEFLYCAAPRKEFYEVAPENVPYYSFANYSSFLDALTKLEVPYVDLAETSSESGLPVSDLFYYTDHHWTPRAGFFAANAICEELNARYGLDYCEQLSDITQYDVTTYPDWFLGSFGKKVGAAFTENGADDFELIIPKFTTDLTVEQPFKNEIREGSFEDTVLYKDNFKKDYYHSNPYATYSGGDVRLQIIRNNLNKEGKKVLIIRDSFACVVTPFIALQTGELHICDIRDGAYYVGDKLNIEDYVKKIEPDYVLILYTGVDVPTSSRYDFFHTNN